MVLKSKDGKSRKVTLNNIIAFIKNNYSFGTEIQNKYSQILITIQETLNPKI